MARPFQGTGQYNAAVPMEWDYGYYKADCGGWAAMTGLSSATSGSVPHSMLCSNSGTQWSDNGAAVITNVASGGTQRTVHAGDWDFGYWKSECGANEYVSGIDQAPGSGNLHGIRCSSASMTNNGYNNCESRLVGTGDDRGNNTGDWDSGYFKSECSAGKVVVGVSTNTSTLKPHRILCCSQ
jgi:hypothetical protein